MDYHNPRRDEQMNRDRARTEARERVADERAEMKLRTIVEEAVRSGRPEREIVALVRQAEEEDEQILREDQQALDWELPRAA
jgi:hypothetical protein